MGAGTNEITEIMEITFNNNRNKHRKLIRVTIAGVEICCIFVYFLMDYAQISIHTYAEYTSNF